MANKLLENRNVSADFSAEVSSASLCSRNSQGKGVDPRPFFPGRTDNYQLKLFCSGELNFCWHGCCQSVIIDHFTMHTGRAGACKQQHIGYPATARPIARVAALAVTRN